MKKELCKKHNVDHTGTSCGACDNLNKRHSNKLRRIRQVVKDFERMSARLSASSYLEDYNNLTDLYTQVKSILGSR
jgi:hypothetical protein